METHHKQLALYAWIPPVDHPHKEPRCSCNGAAMKCVVPIPDIWIHNILQKSSNWFVDRYTPWDNPRYASFTSSRRLVRAGYSNISELVLEFSNKHGESLLYIVLCRWNYMSMMIVNSAKYKSMKRPNCPTHKAPIHVYVILLWSRDIGIYQFWLTQCLCHIKLPCICILCKNLHGVPDAHSR